MFKDSWARDEIRKLWAGIGDGRAEVGWGARLPLWSYVASVEKQVDKLEARLNSTELVEKQCPTCGRVTLMKRVAGPVLEGTHILNDYSQSTVTMLPATPTFYCYGCGLTYRESTKQVLEEVKGG